MSEARRKKTLQASVSDKAVADTSKMVKHSEVLGSMTSRHRPTHPTLHVVNRYGQAGGTEVHSPLCRRDTTGQQRKYGWPGVVLG